jgi:hypothetical protein
LRRRSVPRVPPWFYAASRRFKNHNHDCLGPYVSRGVVTKCFLRKRQMRRYGIHDAHLGASAPFKCSHMSIGGTAPPLQSRQVQISSKLRRGKDIGPTCRFAASLEVGPGATIRSLQTGYPCAQDLSQVPRRQTPHSTWEGCGITTCPMALAPHPSEGGLRCHHMFCGSRPAFRCGRALASLCVPWHWACLPAGEGSGVTTCPAVLKPPPGAGGL